MLHKWTLCIWVPRNFLEKHLNVVAVSNLVSETGSASWRPGFHEVDPGERGEGVDGDLCQ